MNVILFYKILLVVLAYALGSFPTAFIIFKANKGKDIRSVGSGNVGGTNVLRSAGPGLAVLTIILDILKGFIPVLMIYLFFPSSYILYVITSVSVLIGHVFPVFLKFKGGKGISTAGGLIIATCVLPISGANLALRLAPAIIIILTVLIIFFITRIMSLGSIVATIINPIIFFIFRYDNFVIIAATIWSAIILIAHRENIKRLFKGEEKKILRKKKEG
ncbi:MAG: glycerol-3-phosphate 1-O-acyltransferase PlsY [Actinobacteria bacterium]|jgi:glycerol-3-phosphate acyltransferase PlsY|nr:glycerol-3-phosphate 1-O-acyltransferase PlsY [Actinomycetota bacterium]